MRVESLTARLEASWDALLERRPESLVYHGLRYRDLLVDLLGCTPEYLVAVGDDDGVEGALPIMAARAGGRPVLNALPYYGSNGAPVADSTEARDELLREFERRAAASASATLVSNPFDPDPGNPPAHNLTDERLSQATPLPEDPERVLETVDSSARRNVRKAQRSGYEVVRDASLLPALRVLHEENMSVLGGRAKQPAFFDAVPRHFREGSDFDLYAARRTGEVAAALLVFWGGRTAEYFMPAVCHAHRREQPLAAILAEALADAVRHGAKSWNWGGTWKTQEGVFRFKRKWGAVTQPYTYYTKLNDAEILELSPEKVLERWPDFFVLPFATLRNAKDAA